MEKNFTNDTLLARWLSGDLTAEELQELESRPDFDDFKKIVAESDKLVAPSFEEEAIWTKIQAKTTASSKKKNEVIRKRVNWWAMAAAASIVLVVSWYFLLKDGAITTETMIGQQMVIALPDGSKAILNAVSSLTYDVNNWQKERQIKLEGEAFFEVEQGATFTVETSNGTVQVLGTSFNVATRASKLSVDCYEGSVRVKQGAISEELGVGESVTVADGRVVRQANDKTEATWLNNESSFLKVPLKEVIQELERQYVVKITYSNVIAGRTYTGGFVHNNLDQALKMVFVPMSIKYEIEENGVVRLME